MPFKAKGSSNHALSSREASGFAVGGVVAGIRWSPQLRYLGAEPLVRRSGGCPLKLKSFEPSEDRGT